MNSKLLILFEYATLNGGENSCLSVLPKLCDEFDVYAAANDVGPLKNELANRNVPVIPFSVFDATGKRFSRETIFSNLDSLAEKVKPDIIHANSLSMSRLLGAWKSLTTFVGKATGHIRDMLRLSKSAINDLNALDQLAAVSRAAVEYHIAQGLTEHKTRVVYNGVDLAGFSPRPKKGALHAELGVPDHWKIVGAIGQIGMRKGVQYYVQAAREVLQLREDIAFVYVGERHSRKAEAVEYEQRLRRDVSDPAFDGRFFFLGRRNDVPQLMNELTILVHAALQEPLGRVLLEAAANHKPIVATDVGGTREIFPLDNMAKVVPAKNAAAISQAIVSFLNNPSMQRDYGATAGEAARIRFSLSQAEAAILRFLAE